MKNLTLAIDEELVEQARELAARRHTTLNAMIRSLLAHELEQESRIAWARAGMKRLMDEAAAKQSENTEAPYRWDRRDAYGEREDRLLPGHEYSDLRGFGEKS